MKKILFAAAMVALAGAQICPASPLPAGPSPANGKTGVSTGATLSWAHGEKAGNYVAGKDGNGHHVFLHTRYTYVNGATLNYPLGTSAGHFRADTNSWSLTDPVFGAAAPLQPDKLYYWRIMEVNTAEPNSPWLGPVWSFTTIGPRAADPSPDANESGASRCAVLTWTPGTQIAYAPDGGHDIYFGTNADDVNNADTGNPLGVYVGRQDENQYAPGVLALETTYYWRIDEANDATGIVRGEVWAFTVTGTSAAAPEPADGAVVGELYDSSVDTMLSWRSGAYAAEADGHDVFFGVHRYTVETAIASPPNPSGIYKGRQTATIYELDDLQLDTTYYWRIDEVNLSHPESPWPGQVWSFRTDSGIARNPVPANGEQGVAAEVALSWEAGFGASTHDVYFGTVSPPPFIRNQPATTYTPARLTRNVTYYWRIDEKGAAGTRQGQLWSFTTAPGPVVTVNQSITYQSIDGFGAHGSMNVWWSNGPFYSQAFLDLIVDDLGLTINRNEYYPKPNEPGQWPKQIGWLQALKAKADASGEPMKFVAAYWTPPHYMKIPQSCCGYTELNPAYRDDLGVYAVQTIQDYNSIGVPLYALSLQNEPNFAEPYNSCVYVHNDTTNQYRDMLKIAGPIIHATWPDVKLYGVEHMLWVQQWPGTSYEQDIIDDADAFEEMGIWAVHGYGNDGQTPDPGSSEASEWTLAKDRFEPTGKHFWMTETSGYSDSWADARQLGQSIYAALKYGHVSAWVWWQLSEPGVSEYALMNSGNPTKRYYVSKQFYRYIRPEAVMVDSVSDDPNVFVVAFKHPAQHTATLVIINTSTAAKLVKLNMDGDTLPEKFTIYRTSASENCIDAGIVAANGSFSAPASSIVTLYGTDLCPLCDFNADTIVDFRDYSPLAGQWLAAPGTPSADIYPPGGDGLVNMNDLAAFAYCWLE